MTRPGHPTAPFPASMTVATPRPTQAARSRTSGTPGRHRGTRPLRRLGYSHRNAGTRTTMSGVSRWGLHRSVSAKTAASSSGVRLGSFRLIAPRRAHSPTTIAQAASPITRTVAPLPNHDDTNPPIPTRPLGGWSMPECRTADTKPMAVEGPSIAIATRFTVTAVTRQLTTTLTARRQSRNTSTPTSRCGLPNPAANPSATPAATGCRPTSSRYAAVIARVRSPSDSPKSRRAPTVGAPIAPAATAARKAAGVDAGHGTFIAIRTTAATMASSCASEYTASALVSVSRESGVNSSAAAGGLMNGRSTVEPAAAVARSAARMRLSS